MIGQSKNPWKVARDWKGRGGFIRELNANSTCEDGDAIITFVMDTTALEFGRHGCPVMQFVFQRSWWNAGVVSLSLCGREWQSFDALWPDYSNYHYTLPYVHVERLPQDLCGKSDNPDAPATIQIKHRISNCGDRGVVTQEPRQKQLFRIISMEVCYY